MVKKHDEIGRQSLLEGRSSLGWSEGTFTGSVVEDKDFAG
jgi:hypothetical protein